MVNKVLTGIKFQKVLNPERSCKYTTQELIGKPLFKDIINDLLTFIAGSKLIIHNAPFDMKFLNHEFLLADKPSIKLSNCIDTLQLAHKIYPEEKVDLDDLCHKFHINEDFANSAVEKLA